ncbi:interleukin-18 receptor accessory protein-like isoform X2 [Seriola aureovittata]|uniref:interleukin-18 receptor accessory protein-like isoform X2 n=1 Tax=Seriola aureovittata TaxID=2871759 RepID=UPI0024BDBDAA|nr:interleukin-18 receptor accessory protein-like isoform X2 [Seriola aureovittata]
MQTGYTLFFLIFPIILEGCCVGNHQKKQTATAPVGLQQETTHWNYRAVEGEIFRLPCKGNKNLVWSRTRDSMEGNEDQSFNCGTEFTVEANHSGKYTCGSKLFLHLKVVAKISLGCFQPHESKVELVSGAGGNISCPGRKCSNNTDVRWFKGEKPMSEQKRDSCEKNGLLHLCKVKADYDHGVFFCDRQIIEHRVIWTFRRAVKVTVVPFKKITNKTKIDIVYPEANMTDKVELGRSHNLTCVVFFPYEKESSAKVQWYVNYSDNKETMTILHKEKPQNDPWYKVTGTAIIKEVTLQHLNRTYTCIASNTVENKSVTIKLEEKIKAKWPSLVGYPIASLLVVAGLGIIFHVKWLELRLIYRSHFPHGKRGDDEKEFDVFLSYVWTPRSAEVEGGWTVPSRSGAATDEEAHLSIMDPLNTEEGEATQRPLEELLPQMLEERWGYRLCLLERDVLPGGAYTNDVVLAIQRSQMLICLLSADYLCNSNAVFVLESGVQALLQNSAFKLLLIQTNRESASLIQQDSPLPTLVQRALKVLPSLNWTSGKPSRATHNFWKSLRKAMPDHRVNLVSLMQDQ